MCRCRSSGPLCSEIWTGEEPRFFRSVTKSDSCLHDLLPQRRDSKILSRLRWHTVYQIPLTKTNNYRSFVHYALSDISNRIHKIALSAALVCVYIWLCWVSGVVHEDMITGLFVVFFCMWLIQNTLTPAYLSHHIRPRESTRHFRSSTTPLLHRPTTRTHFADRAFRCSAPAVWNYLNTDTMCCNSLALFKRSLKHFSSVRHLGLALAV